MDPTKEIVFECLPIIRVYKDGTIERLYDSGYAAPGPDPSTRTTSKDVLIDPDVALRARLYLPESANSASRKLPILVYFHGGGFCSETAFSRLYNPFLGSLSARAHLLVVSIDYRLAPENPIPAAYDDCFRGLQWAAGGGPDEWISAHGDTARVFVAGDSAGGNIAHNVALRAGEAGIGLEGAVLIHPYFWGTERMGSEHRRTGAFLRPDHVDGLWRFVCGGGAQEISNDDPRMNPLAEGEGEGEWTRKMEKCGRVLVAEGGEDVLRDRGRAYCRRLRGSGWGGSVHYFESDGEDHVFFLFHPQCQKALQFMDVLVAFFNNV